VRLRASCAHTRGAVGVGGAFGSADVASYLAPAGQGDRFGIGGWWRVVLGKFGGFVGARRSKSRFFALLRMTIFRFIGGGWGNGGRWRGGGMRI